MLKRQRLWDAVCCRGPLNDNNNEKKMENELASRTNLHFWNYDITVCEIQPANTPHIQSTLRRPSVGVRLLGMPSTFK